MSKRDEVKDYLSNQFCGVYCDTCSGEMDDECDDCNRKAMGWSLSQRTAEKIADKILKIIGE